MPDVQRISNIGVEIWRRSDGITITAKENSLGFWMMDVICERPLEQFRMISSREEVLCLADKMLKQYDRFRDIYQT